MDFELNELQKTIQETFARFADERIIPAAESIDETKEFPMELFHEVGKLGFFGMRYPESAGGSGIIMQCLLGISDVLWHFLHQFIS